MARLSIPKRLLDLTLRLERLTHIVFIGLSVEVLELRVSFRCWFLVRLDTEVPVVLPESLSKYQDGAEDLETEKNRKYMVRDYMVVYTNCKLSTTLGQLQEL